MPCIIADDLTEEQIKAYRLVDNKTAEFATWDYELLDNELSEIFDIDMSIYDFDINIEEEETEVEEDNFDVELPEEPKAKLGDIYQLGKHRLMCGDSTSIADVEKLMNGNKADISFTSPPYNVGHNLGYDNKKSKYIDDNDNKSENEYVNFLKQFTENAINNSKHTFVNIQSLANNKISLIDYMYIMKKYYADTMIWDKGFGVPAMAKNVLNSSFEYIHIFNMKANKSIGTKEFRGTLPNVVGIQRQTKNEFSDIHNATFPIELPSFFVTNFTNKNDVVLDLFGGTGTTLIACEQLNRQCYMNELDPKYVDVIINRWEQLTGDKAVLLNEYNKTA